MIEFRRLRRLDKTPIRLPTQPAARRVQPFSRRTLLHAARVMGPTLVALTFAGVAHAQGTMDLSGAQTLMGTFKMNLILTDVIRSKLIWRTVEVLCKLFHGLCRAKIARVLTQAIGRLVCGGDSRSVPYLRGSRPDRRCHAGQRLRAESSGAQGEHGQEQICADPRAGSCRDRREAGYQRYRRFRRQARLLDSWAQGRAVRQWCE